MLPNAALTRKGTTSYSWMISPQSVCREEKNDREYSFELTDGYEVVAGYPPDARVDKITITNSYDMTVKASCLLDNSALTPDYFDLYVVPHGDEIDFDSLTI